MGEAYRASDPGFDGRITVPVLWDTQTDQIVNNESSDIIRMMAAPDSLGGLGRGGDLDLYPVTLRAEIDTINDRIYDTVNNGVYRAGFARRQDAYEQAFAALFASFDWLEALLGECRYLAGESVTEADWRLFPTLVRFDEVYNLHFRCNRRRLVDYPNLWAYSRELYQCRVWRGRSRWSRSSATTTRPTTSSTPSASSPSAPVTTGLSLTREACRARSVAATDTAAPWPADLDGVRYTRSRRRDWRSGGVHHREATTSTAARLGTLRSSISLEVRPSEEPT